MYGRTVISEVAFGKPLGFMASDTDVHNLITSAHNGLVVLVTLARSDWIKSALRHPLIMKYFSPAMDKETGIGRLLEERDTIVAERINEISAGTHIGKRVDLMQQ